MKQKYKIVSRLSSEEQESISSQQRQLLSGRQLISTKINTMSLDKSILKDWQNNNETVYRNTYISHLYQVQKLMTIKHPHILTPVNYFIEDNTLTMICQFCQGGNLYDMVQSRKPKQQHFSEHLLLNWLLQLLIAIDFLHHKKLLHRRLSLKSIYLTNNAMFKVSNFGLPNISQKKDLSDRMHCISPEICEGKQYSIKSEIWSLGCVVSTCANLQYPFEGRTVGELVRKITTVKHHPIINLYGKHMRQLIDKTLQKDEKKRPTASELLFDDLMIKVMNNSVNSSNNLKKQLAITLKQSPKIESKSTVPAMKKIEQFQRQTTEALSKLKEEGIRGKQVDQYVAQFQGLLGKLRRVVSEGPSKQSIKQQNLSLSVSKVGVSAVRQKDIEVGLEKTIESIGFEQSFGSLTISSKIKTKPQQHLGLSLKESQKIGDTLAVKTSQSIFQSLEKSLQKSLVSSVKVLRDLQMYIEAHPEVVLHEDSLDYTLSNAGSMIKTLLQGSRDSMKSFRISTNSLNPQEGSCQNRDLNITMSKEIEQELRKLVQEQEYQQVFDQFSDPPCLSMQERSHESGSKPLYQSEIEEGGKKDLKHLLVLSEIKQVSNQQSSVYGGTTSHLNFTSSNHDFKK